MEIVAINCWREGGQGTYPQISAEKKEEIGHCAAEYGVLAMIQSYYMKLPVPLNKSGLGILSSVHLQNLIQWNFPNQQYLKY